MRCHSLERLSLAVNQLEGSIPTQIWNLSEIQVVNMITNNLGGAIPPSIGNLSNLEFLGLGYNTFQGAIPQEIGQLSRLIVLDLSSNKLNGEVPKSIFNLSGLADLWLGFNNLSGKIPSSIDTSLPNIMFLDLSANRFFGKIPSSVSNLSSLTLLQIGLNLFTGDIPINLGNLHQLEKLSLPGNGFTNNISKPEQDFISSLSNCKYLRHIHIEGNPMTGVLPKSLGSTNLSASLEFFNAESCQIVSPLPNELGNLRNLTTLLLGDNNLTGLIPTALASWHNLQVLSVKGNKFEGSISHVLCNLTKLYSLDLSGNNFSGEIPRCLGGFPLLREVYLANNAFNYEIPSSLWLSGHLDRMNLSNNFITGSLPQEVGHMEALIELDLSGNQLFGEIPDTFSKLQSLVVLSLSNNKLDGPLRTSFSNLKGLVYLDLSRNNLSGPIPKSLEALTYLNYFNVSFNKLNGEIPDGGMFVNFTSDSFLGNHGLCGAPRFKVEECSAPTPSRKTRHLKYILPTIIISLVLVAAFVLFLVMRRNRFVNPLDDAPILEHRRISYYEILNATGNLGEGNLIGRGSSGSVYKACFSDAMVAAVKVFNFDVQGALTTFDTECQILSSIRHRNLVKVITSCSNLDFKALVLAFMPNGNLGKWLYTADCSLNIFQILEVMVDVATALEYLHDGYSSFPIVHCDLKPQNILLDENMVAHVGDFGIAKLLTQEQRMHQTRTLGTIGYMAPEYGGAFANFTVNSFLGNQGLCGVQRLKVKECKRSVHKLSRKSTQCLKVVLPVIMISSVFVVVVILFLIIRRNRSVNPILYVSPIPEHPTISYYEILHATSNLGEGNIIGRGSSGSVYRACFSDEMVAAVKVFNFDAQGEITSFDKECQILRSIRHRNLVKVITSCSNLDFKALVLAFMPNGNLGKWLYSADCSLNIFQTLEVMVDVATTLEYLHDDYSSFPVVHCDLKPQNILLDENMVAHVGDFGIAKLLTQEQRVHQTRTLGTIGYMAPEYGSQGLVSTMVDVYSYGILLMEICSRRKPTDDVFSGELTMRKWMEESFPDRVMHVVDNALVNMDVGGRRVDYVSCFTSIIELALECTKDMPAERPIMKHVLERMKKIKSNLSQGTRAR